MKQHIELQGQVIKSLPGRHFEVEVAVGTAVHKVICAIKGKLYQNKISIVAGDEVKVEVSPYDLKRGFIALRLSKSSVETVKA